MSREQNPKHARTSKRKGDDFRQDRTEREIKTNKLQTSILNRITPQLLTHPMHKHRGIEHGAHEQGLPKRGGQEKTCLRDQSFTHHSLAQCQILLAWQKNTNLSMLPLLSHIFLVKQHLSPSHLNSNMPSARTSIGGWQQSIQDCMYTRGQTSLLVENINQFSYWNLEYTTTKQLRPHFTCRHCIYISYVDSMQDRIIFSLVIFNHISSYG